SSVAIDCNRVVAVAAVDGRGVRAHPDDDRVVAVAAVEGDAVVVSGEDAVVAVACMHRRRVDVEDPDGIVAAVRLDDEVGGADECGGAAASTERDANSGAIDEDRIVPPAAGDRCVWHGVSPRPAHRPMPGDSPAIPWRNSTSTSEEKLPTS